MFEVAPVAVINAVAEGLLDTDLPSLEKGIARLVNSDINAAINVARTSPLMKVASPSNRTKLLRTAIRNDVRTAHKLISDDLQLPPATDLKRFTATARLNAGQLIVVPHNDGSSHGRRGHLVAPAAIPLRPHPSPPLPTELPAHIQQELDRQATPSAASVRLKALDLDIFSICTPSSGGTFRLAVVSEKAELFQVLALRAVVQLRWNLYGKRLFFWEAAIFLLALFLLIFISVTLSDWNKPPTGQQYRTVLVILMLAGITVLNEGLQLWHMRRRYFRSVWNWMDAVRACLTMAFCITLLQSSQSSRSLLAWTVVLQWLRSLYFLLPFDSTGPLIIMIIEILKDTYVFLFVLLTVLLGAANGLFVLLHDSGAPGADATSSAEGFGDVAAALFTTANMLLFGDYDQGAFDSSSDGLTARIIFLGVMFVTLIILLNLLIAILSDSYERVQDRSAMELTLARAEILDSQQLSLHRYLLQAALFLYNVLVCTSLRAVAQHCCGCLQDTPSTDSMSLCTWPRKAYVFIPEVAAQDEQEDSRWQGMLHDVKETVGSSARSISNQLDVMHERNTGMQQQLAEQLTLLRAHLQNSNTSVSQSTGTADA